MTSQNVGGGSTRRPRPSILLATTELTLLGKETAPSGTRSVRRADWVRGRAPIQGSRLEETDSTVASTPYRDSPRSWIALMILYAAAVHVQSFRASHDARIPFCFASSRFSNTCRISSRRCSTSGSAK